MKEWVIFQSRRGMKELDLILEWFAHRVYERLEKKSQILYHDFLQESDGDIWDWFFQLRPAPEKYRIFLHILREHFCPQHKSILEFFDDKI